MQDMDHFDPATRAVISAAATAARDCGHAQITPAHLIVGLLAVPATEPGDALASLGLTETAATARLAVLDVPPGPLVPGMQMFDPAAIGALRAAAADAELLLGGPADPTCLARCLLVAGDPGVDGVLGPRVDAGVALDALDAVGQLRAA